MVDNEKAEMHTIPEWCKIFFEEQGIVFNTKTLNRRRMVTGIGLLSGPRKRYLMTRDEFVKVVNTPLPQCKNVIVSVSA